MLAYLESHSRPEILSSAVLSWLRQYRTESEFAHGELQWRCSSPDSELRTDGEIDGSSLIRSEIGSANEMTKWGHSESLRSHESATAMVGVGFIVKEYANETATDT